MNAFHSAERSIIRLSKRNARTVKYEKARFVKVSGEDRQRFVIDFFHDEYLEG